MLKKLLLLLSASALVFGCTKIIDNDRSGIIEIRGEVTNAKDGSAAKNAKVFIVERGDSPILFDLTDCDENGLYTYGKSSPIKSHVSSYKAMTVSNGIKSIDTQSDHLLNNDAFDKDAVRNIEIPESSTLQLKCTKMSIDDNLKCIEILDYRSNDEMFLGSSKDA